MKPEYTTRLLSRLEAFPEISGAAANQQTLHQALHAITEGNYDVFGDALAEDAEMEILGTGPMDGLWRGGEAIVAALRSNFALLDEQEPEMEKMLAHDNYVVVLLRERGVFKADQRPYEYRAVIWYTFDGGRIKRIDEIAAAC
jgi:ketosteroid isomerase-like protein